MRDDREKRKWTEVLETCGGKRYQANCERQISITQKEAKSQFAR